MSSARILCFATQGTGHPDEQRLAALLADTSPIVHPFDRNAKVRSLLRLLGRLLREPPDLVVMEGTGIAGGIALLLARTLRGVPYVVSSGDAVGPFIGARQPLLKPVTYAYERLLCLRCAGFIGWTPYLTGRALTYGAPRAMTAPGWAPTRPAGAASRARVRERLAIPPDAFVIGIVGSLDWNPRVGYCYGLEIVEAVRRVARDDVHALVVGDGSGRERLQRRAGELLGRRVHLPGRVPRAEVPEYLAAMDLASLPQSVDQVGSFRYTTKLPEYLAAGLPVVTGQIPLAYDLDDGWVWRLPGAAPWTEVYLTSLVERLERAGVPPRPGGKRVLTGGLFNADVQRAHTREFIRDVLDARGPTYESRIRS